LKCFDVLKGSDKSLHHPYDLIYSFTCGIIEDGDNFVIIVAMAILILCRSFCGNFGVRQHLNWELHVSFFIKRVCLRGHIGCQFYLSTGFWKCLYII
jgi:hypothetical protein